MAVTTVCHYHINRHFRRYFTSLSALLPTVSYQSLIRVPTFNDKYKDKNGRAMSRTCKFHTQSLPFKTFACKYKQLESCICHNPCYQNLHSSYSTYLSRTYNPNTIHCTHLNTSFRMTPELNSVTIRGYHGSSKFTIKNPLFSSYLESLVEEFNSLNENQNSSKDAELHQQQVLRSNFLKPVVEVIKKLQEKYSEIQELLLVLDGESDNEMKKMIEKEVEKCNETIEEFEGMLMSVLVEDDPADHNDIVLEVTAGVGGQEAMLFTAEVLNMYCNYAHYKGWTITGLDSDKNELGGTRRAAVEISGDDVYKHMKFEAGVHRVQRIPKTEKAGRVHTSTTSVSVLPQPKEIDIDIQPKDLKIDTFRNSGPGGQSVNTTDSAVRITHIPTGTVAECRQERSQIKNKELALKSLKHKMYQVIFEEQEFKRRATRKMQIGTRARSDKIRTYNFQQDRVTDHRLKESYSDLAVFMTGNVGLDNLICSLGDLDRLHALEYMLEEYETHIMDKKSGKS